MASALFNTVICFDGGTSITIRDTTGYRVESDAGYVVVEKNGHCLYFNFSKILYIGMEHELDLGKEERDGMRIIELGNTDNLTRKFRCSRCGCLFEAGPTEYDMRGVFDRIVECRCDCPCCGNQCHREEPFEEGGDPDGRT